MVEETVPQGAVVVNPKTLVKVKQSDLLSGQAPRVSYEDIGGLDMVNVIQHPLRYPGRYYSLKNH